MDIREGYKRWEETVPSRFDPTSRSREATTTGTYTTRNPRIDCNVFALPSASSTLVR